MRSWAPPQPPDLLACFVTVELGPQRLTQLDGHGTIETVEPTDLFVPAPLLDPHAALKTVRLTRWDSPTGRER
jgi:hypothetical protein